MHGALIGMPRYYFHLYDGPDVVPDDTGMDLADIQEARIEAIKSARDILADQLRAGEALDGQLIEIADEKGTVLGIVKFKDALRPDGTVH
jgi:hypothetical protein